jgi:hypothetical protein
LFEETNNFIVVGGKQKWQGDRKKGNEALFEGTEFLSLRLYTHNAAL